MAGGAPFILARRSGNRAGCLILSSIERFSPLSALEDMLRDAAGCVEERRVGRRRVKGEEGFVEQYCLCTKIKIQDPGPSLD